MGVSKSRLKTERKKANIGERRAGKHEASAGNQEHRDDALIIRGILRGLKANGTPYTNVAEWMTDATNNGVIVNGPNRTINEEQSKRWMTTMREVRAREMTIKRDPAGKQLISA